MQKPNKYSLYDINNIDKILLFYSMALDCTTTSKQIEGIKKEKTWLFVAFTNNVDGSDKLDPLFICHANKLRCFNKKTSIEFGFYYFNNKKN